MLLHEGSNEVSHGIFSFFFFSLPEPKAPGELIGWEGSVVRRPSSSSVHNFKRLLL